MVSGHPPVLIRNSEIMDQLYLMEDEFKDFHSTMRTFNARLSAVEKRTGGIQGSQSGNERLGTRSSSGKGACE